MRPLPGTTRTSRGSSASDIAALRREAGDARSDGAGASRASLLRKALLATGVLGLGGGLAGSLGDATAAPSERGDIRILNFLLLLEYAQEELYAQAQSRLSGELRRFAETAGEHERRHVEALRAILGAEARKKPRFRTGEAVGREGRFVATALTLEELAVSGYIAQAANLTAKRITAVARIIPVEARHAAWIRALAGRLPAPWVADPAKKPEQITETLGRTGLVERR